MCLHRAAWPVDCDTSALVDLGESSGLCHKLGPRAASDNSSVGCFEGKERKKKKIPRFLPVSTPPACVYIRWSRLLVDLLSVRRTPSLTGPEPPPHAADTDLLFGHQCVGTDWRERTWALCLSPTGSLGASLYRLCFDSFVLLYLSFCFFFWFSFSVSFFLSAFLPWSLSFRVKSQAPMWKKWTMQPCSTLTESWRTTKTRESLFHWSGNRKYTH